MADEVNPRTPDEILARIDMVASTSLDGLELRGLVWEVIEDVRSSYRLALEGLVPPLPSERIDEVQDTVRDYLVNNYGDD